MPPRVSTASGRNTRPCCWQAAAALCTFLSNTLERELSVSAAATLALVLAKGSVTVTSKALSVMPAPDEDIPRLQCREDDAPFFKQVVTGKGHFSDSSCSPPSCSSCQHLDTLEAVLSENTKCGRHLEVDHFLDVHLDLSLSNKQQFLITNLNA